MIQGSDEVTSIINISQCCIPENFTKSKSVTITITVISIIKALLDKRVHSDFKCMPQILELAPLGANLFLLLDRGVLEGGLFERKRVSSVLLLFITQKKYS